MQESGQYSTLAPISFTIKNNTNIFLNESQREALDQDITYEEIYQAAKSMVMGKVPGCDGLPIEFYLKYWEELKPLIWPMYELVLKQKILGESAHKGLISLIPKKEKDSQFIKNLRPLTLLNTDYKILTKVFATCLKTVLPDIIGEQQVGFMEIEMFVKIYIKQSI